ncbi:MAG: hypothetical protein MJ078_03075, partial [Clostridia bacterium]|nr:hypothetical protein [Clostridia bacterium]
FLWFDMSNIPVFDTVRQLIEIEWHTSVTQEVAGSSAVFRGFYGDYDMRFTYNGKTTEKALRIREDENNVYTVVLD